MEQLQSYQHQYVDTFESLDVNEPFKDENTLIAMGSVGEWALSQNPRTPVLEPAADIPVNTLDEEVFAEGSLVARQEVE